MPPMLRTFLPRRRLLAVAVVFAAATAIAVSALHAGTHAAPEAPPSQRAGAPQEGPSGTLIVSNMDGVSVSLLDLPSGELRATIPARAAPHEVAVSSDGGTAVVTNYGQPGDGNLLQVIDVASGRLVREMVVEGRMRLHGVAFLPGDSLLALTSETTQEIVVVSAADGSERRAMGTGGGAPHMLALGGGWIWAANIVGGSVVRMDAGMASPARTWPAGPRTEGVATTPDGREGWTGSMEEGTVVGVDASGDIVARVTGLQVPYRLAVTADGGTVVVSDPGGEQVGLIDRASGTLAATVDVRAASVAAGLGPEPSPQGFTLTPDGRWALVSAKGIDRVVVIDVIRAAVVGFVVTGDGPDGIGFSPVRMAP